MSSVIIVNYIHLLEVTADYFQLSRQYLKYYNLLKVKLRFLVKEIIINSSFERPLCLFNVKFKKPEV